MQCKELEAVLEQEGLSPLPLEAREHLAGCAACQDLLADLSAIVVAAKRIPAEVNPPDRIWVSLRAQLESEGIIREPDALVEVAVAPWWRGFSEFFRPRVLATVGAVLFVVFGSVYVAKHTGVGTSSKNPTQPQVANVTKGAAPRSSEAPAVPAPKKTELPTLSVQDVSPSSATPSESNAVLKPSPSEDVYGGSAAVLTETEGALPTRELANNAAVDASLRQNLRTLNEFIAECEARLKQNPRDQLTREYLNMAYQQKAELLTAMMDNGRSEQ
jgi:hypothetical protein